MTDAHPTSKERLPTPAEMAMRFGSWFDRKDLTLQEREREVALLLSAYLSERDERRAHETSGEQRLTLDTSRQVFFYEQDHYYLSNFSAFRLHWKGINFDTSEAAYHWEKFPDSPIVRREIAHARSAHDAFKIAEESRSLRREDWDGMKVDLMRDILRAKATQHEYVRRKLLQTGDRELIENSWRDAFWGWGPNRDGQNMLGKLWMDVRAELRSAQET